jgi:NADPH:quinone reductase-like Zn-dependent oxidoreductase
MELCGKALTRHSYLLGEIVRDPERQAQALSFIFAGLEKGTLTPIIDRCFPRAQIVEAHRDMESNEQFGKIVVTV